MIRPYSTQKNKKNKNKKLLPVAVSLCTMPSFGRGFIIVSSNPLTAKRTLSEFYCHLII